MAFTSRLPYPFHEQQTLQMDVSVSLTIQLRKLKFSCLGSDRSSGKQTTESPTLIQQHRCSSTAGPRPKSVPHTTVTQETSHKSPLGSATPCVCAGAGLCPQSCLLPLGSYVTKITQEHCLPMHRGTKPLRTSAKTDPVERF